jgi:dienelactone hydrolase
MVFKMRINMRFALAALSALVMLVLGQTVQAHHSPLPTGMSKAEAAWLWGHYTIPANITRDNSPYWYRYEHTDINKINSPPWMEVAAGHTKPDARAPAVLVMHGCSGIFGSPNSYQVFFMERGFAVFEPDSFARPDHTCKYGDLDTRTEDLEYALAKMQELPWVDQDRILLMGISQGGATVARWSKPGFAAHIILADNCDGTNPLAPADIPVLAVVGGEDENYQGSSCQVKRQIIGSRSIVIPDAPHGIIDYDETVQAMAKLLSLTGL